METKTWKWRRDNTACLGSVVNPDATVYVALAAPKASRFRWTTMVGGLPVAVSVDPQTAQRVARAALKEVR